MSSLEIRFLELSYSLEAIKKVINELNVDSINEVNKRLLEELFKMKTFHFLIFEKLLHLKEYEFAETLLIKYYLGEHISLNNYHKDHVRDLEILIDDFVEITGEDRLVRLFENHYIPQVNRKNLILKEIVKEAFEVESDDEIQWLIPKQEELSFSENNLYELENMILNDERDNLKQTFRQFYEKKNDEVLKFTSDKLFDFFEENSSVFLEVDLIDEREEFIHSHEFLLEQINRFK